MALKKIQEDLQKKDSQYAQRERDSTPYNEWNKKEEARSNGDGLWKRASDRLAKTRMNATLWGVLAIFVVCIVSIAVYAYVRYQNGYFREDKVSFGVVSVSDIQSGRSLEFVVNYSNTNRAALVDTRVIVSFGEYFVPVESEDFQVINETSGVLNIGQIPPESSGKKSIIGQFVAPQNETEVVALDFEYAVPRRSGVYSKQESTSITVTSSPLLVDILAPEKVSVGDIVDFRVVFRNSGPEPITDVGLEMGYPEGFILQAATPLPTENGKLWKLGTLDPEQIGEIRIKGILQGSIGDFKNFQAQVVQGGGEQKVSYTRDNHSFLIEEAPLTIVQKKRGGGESAKAGEGLIYDVTFTNTTNVPLRDISLSALIDGGGIVDYSTLRASNDGFFDESSRTIEWKAVNVSSLGLLNPGDSGRVSYSVGIKNLLPIVSTDDTNFAITSLIRAKSLDFPSFVAENKDTLSNTIITPLEAKVTIGSSVEHISGPVNLEAGAVSQFRVTLDAGSINNDIKDVKMTGFVSPGVKIVESSLEDGVIYSTTTKQLAWNVGRIENATGVLRPNVETSFIVEVKPTNAHSDTLGYLMQDVRFSATDLFTKKEIRGALDVVDIRQVVGSDQ